MPCSSIAVVRARLGTKLPAPIVKALIDRTLATNMEIDLNCAGRTHNGKQVTIPEWIEGRYNGMRITYHNYAGQCTLSVTAASKRAEDIEIATELKNMLEALIKAEPQRLALMALTQVGKVNKLTKDEAGNLILLMEMK